jgi:hypothetical protein
MFRKQFIVTLLVLAASVVRADGQDQPMPPMPGMPGMKHGDSPPPAPGGMNMVEIIRLACTS